MSMYEIGTITGAAGTRVINGSGTQWANNLYGVSVGSVLMIYGAGTVDAYQITKVVSNTQVEVSRALAKAVSNVSYGIITSETASTASFSNQLIETMDYYRRNVLAWQKIVTETGDVTITAPDGTTVTVPSMKGVRADLDKKANKSELGNSSTRDVGIVTGSVAAGDDSRLNTINGKTGGLINGVVKSQGVTGIVTDACTAIGWDGSNGVSEFVNNRGLGTGGFRYRVANKSGGLVTQFEMRQDGAFAAPLGSYSVAGRVRAFSAIGNGYLEVSIDGAQKGINFFDSDEELKENIKDVNPGRASEVIIKLRPVSYKFKDSVHDGVKTTGSSYEFGVIAQELEKILPNGVITMSDGKKALNPLEIFGLLLTAQKESLLKINELEAKIEEIKSKK